MKENNASKEYSERLLDKRVSLDYYGLAEYRRRAEKFDSYDIEQAYEDGQEYIMSLPLEDKLSDSEKYKILKLYSECQSIDMSDNPCLPQDSVIRAGAKIEVLTYLFGEKFFEEGLL